MVPKSEEAPVIRLGEPLAVLHCHVDAVVSAVEITSTGWLLSGAVRKSRVKNPGQLFYDDRSFWKLACLQIGVDVFLFNVYVVILGEVRLPIVEAVGRQGGTHKNPRAKTGWQLYLAIGIEDGALFSLGGHNRFRGQ